MDESFEIGSVSGLLKAMKERMLSNDLEALTVEITCEGMEDFEVHLFFKTKTPEYPRLVPN